MTSKSQCALPPRRAKDYGRVSRSLPKTTLDLLIDMGFSKQLSQKVIAAVGDKDIHVAVDWLMSHLEDPTLKEPTPREYVVYLCPVGDLNKSLVDFWDKSQMVSGWNGVHSRFPHITLTPFFDVPDSKVAEVIEVFTSLHDRLHQSPGSIRLECYSATNFIGLFVPQDYHGYLDSVMADFAHRLSKLGIKFETRKKQMHLTLAYHFPVDRYSTLDSLVKHIDLDSDVRWDVRLYSRNHRHSQSRVYRVQQNYTAMSGDDIDLIEGDFMFVQEEVAAANSDGWLYGTSWLTGCSGVFPASFCRRTSEMWTWTLHKSITVDHSDNLPLHYNDVSEADITYLYSQVKRRRSAPTIPPRAARGPRKLIVMRHGERVDFVFGKDWIHQCFNESGEYSRTDLNLQRQLPQRHAYTDYLGDSPLTEIGLLQSVRTGEALNQAGVTVTHVYTSPSFRCIQTAAQVIKGLGVDVEMNVEPALFEWLQWYQLGLPKWFTLEELAAYGYPVNRSYVPHYDHDRITKCHGESLSRYYSRGHDFTLHVLSQHTLKGECILFVGHATTADVSMRQCRGMPPRTMPQLQEFMSKVPYCNVAMYEENPATRKWMIKNSPVLPLTHSANKGMLWLAEKNL